MKIDPQWIALADELPEHGTDCIVGNVNKRDESNPLLGSKWEEATATFCDRQKALDESNASMAVAGYKCLMQVPLIGPRLIFMTSTGQYKEVSEFTHWWPIPKPFDK